MASKDVLALICGSCNGQTFHLGKDLETMEIIFRCTNCRVVKALIVTMESITLESARKN